MNYNNLIIILFIIFFDLKIEIKKIILLLIVLCYFLYKKKLDYDETNNKIKLYPELKSLDNDLINFYFENSYLNKFDSVNFNESLHYTKKLIDLYNKIKDSPLKYYENDILNEYKLNSLKSFENIQYSIPMNNNDLTNKIKLLNRILSKYKLDILDYNNINIYTKYNNKKINEYNKNYN